MFCNQCGSSIPDGNTVCTNCGAPVAKPAGGQAPIPAEEQPKKKSPLGIILLIVMGIAIVLLLGVIAVLIILGVTFVLNKPVEVQRPDNNISVIEPDAGHLQDNIYADIYDLYADFVLPGSDSEYLCYRDIDGMTEEELTVAEQEIYARHGMAFSDQDLQAYFAARSWYAPGSGEFFPNAYEQANLDLIRIYRAKEDGSLYRSGNEYLEAFSRSRDYAIADSDYQLLSGEDLEDMSEEQLCVARNEILARRGWIFDDEDLREYFFSKEWYVPAIPGDEFDYNSLTATEQSNISLIKIYEELGNGNLKWSAKNPYEAVYDQYAHQDYIFAGSSKQRLTHRDLDGMTEDELCIARNEIFARNGYTFKSMNLMEYFFHRSWYSPTSEVGNSNSIVFTPVEKDNIDLLHEAELEAAKNDDRIYRVNTGIDLSKLDTALGYSVSCEAFTVKLPNYWKEYAVVTCDANRIYFYDRISQEAGCGGLVMELWIWTEDWDYTQLPNYRYLGTVTSPNGQTYPLIRYGPSDVQFDWDNMELYNKMSGEEGRIIDTITARNGWTYTKG